MIYECEYNEREREREVYASLIKRYRAFCTVMKS